MEPFLAGSSRTRRECTPRPRSAKYALEVARESVARCCGCEPAEIVFTGGGSEADNLAVKGAAWAARDRDRGARRRRHAPPSSIRPCSARPTGSSATGSASSGCGARRRRARSISMRSPTLLDARTAVVSVMLVNNESGIVQPLREVVRARARPGRRRRSCTPTRSRRSRGSTCGAVAADVDLRDISGHNSAGPKGVGALMVRDGVELVPLVDGGGQEGERRAGTQNVAGIVGLAAAARADRRAARASTAPGSRALRDRLESRSRPRGARLCGERRHRARGSRASSRARSPVREAESLLVSLDQRDVYASSGSACASGAIDPSHVLLAMGLTPERARASVRFSLGHTNHRRRHRRRARGRAGRGRSDSWEPPRE